MYYPKSQIKTDLFTNGNEYILSTTKEEYKGYYYELSNGNKYTGKTPEDGPNILLTVQNLTDLEIEIFSNQSPQFIEIQDEISGGTYNKTPLIRSLPQFNPTLPTPQEQSLGAFTRYFCKKNNELRYIETNKTTYDQLKSKDSKIAWDLYTPLEVLWNIKGTKEQVTRANKTTIALLEQRQKWYGFSQYLKEDYLKYYVGV
jgi:hypothetical protein